jgi:EmrB/QacA subfamily drug resistance transporter
MAETTTRTLAAPQPATPHRWLTLGVVALAQLMVALDATIVSIALPSAQSALGFSDADRGWVISAYTLSFGGLLLLGGRLADYLGRKRAFLLGLAAFAFASTLGGAAPNFAVLIIARSLQGASGALLAPTALSLLAVTFTEPRERANAFAVYGTIAGTGGALGLLLGGAITQLVDWRWCLYVNDAIAVVAAVGGWFVIADVRFPNRPGFDIPGVILGTGALGSLVYACTRAITEGWTSGSVLGLVAGSAVLLALFVWRETRAETPLLPLGIVLDRNRGGAYISAALMIAGMFGAFLFITYYLQVVLHYSPFQAGLAFLPLSLAGQLGSWAIASRLMPYVPPRFLMAPGALVAAAGLALLTQIQVDSGYASLILPAEILIGVGISCVMVPAFSVGTHGVDPREAGAAAATVNAAGQVGGSVGTAVLNMVATSATVSYLAARHLGPAFHVQALVYGYAQAAAYGAAILAAAAIAAAILVNAPAPKAATPSGSKGSSTIAEPTGST